MRKPVVLVSGLVLMLSMLACQAGPLSTLFATPTPTATNTPTVTPSPTVTPTFTPSPTPEPTLTPTPAPEGVVTEKQADGATLVTDYSNKFAFVLPAGWTVIPLTGKDISSMLDEFSNVNPDMEQYAETFAQMDPDIVRLVALNNDKKFVYKSFATNITVMCMDDKTLSTMPVAFVTAMLEGGLERGGAKVITQGANIITSDSGVEVGVVEAEKSVPTASGNSVVARQRMLVFQANNKLVVINLTVPSQFIDELSPTLEAVAQSVLVQK